jgi:hypothetical protein
MKNLKGIFESQAEKLSPDIADKSRIIADMMMFQSGAMKKADLSKETDLEDMALPYEGISIPVDTQIKDNLNEASKEKTAKALSTFDMPSFSKDDMAVDTGHFLEKGLGSGLKEQVSEKLTDSLMSVDNIGKSKSDLDRFIM